MIRIKLQGLGNKYRLSKSFRDLIADVENTITKRAYQEAVEAQIDALKDFGEDVKRAVQSGGLGRLPAGSLSSRSGSYLDSASYSVYRSSARNSFYKSSISFEMDSGSSLSAPGTKPDFSRFEESTNGNVSFNKRKNKGKGGLGFDYVTSLEQGRNKFLRRNPKGYRTIDGRLSYKGFHILDSTVQFLYPEFRNNLDKEQEKLIKASMNYLARKWSKRG